METQNGNTGIIETGRGPTIAGIRISLYDVMDYLKDEWVPRHVAMWLRLTLQQISDAIAYLNEHKAEMEERYIVANQRAEEERLYWEERNKERESYPIGPSANYKIAIARARLEALKKERLPQT